MIFATDSAIVPYDYQQECLDVLEVVEKKQDTALVVKAGGLGKTILSAFYVKHRFETYHEKRCLYLSHLTENLEQAENDYRKVLSDVTYGYFTGDEKAKEDVNILYATFQAIRDNLHLFHPEAFDIIVVDESHHSKAPTHEKVVIHFTPHFILAITATSDRMDGLDIRELYGEPVYSLPFVDALCRKKLCPIDYRIMTDEIGSLKKIQTQKGRLSINHLNRTVFVPKRDEEIVKIIKSNMAEIENPCVKIYVESTDYAELLAEMLPGSIPIHNKVPKAERKIRLALFRQGIFKILISVDMFNESLDVPQINMEVFLRATDSLTVFYQQLMRGCRLHPSKKVLRVLDFVANCDRIIQVYELWSKVKTQTSFQSSPAVDPFVLDQGVSKFGSSPKNGVNPLFGMSSQSASDKKKDSIDPFVLNVDSVEFREKVIPLIETIMQVRSEFHSNWQEASESVKNLAITNPSEYAEKYKEDPRLPSGPARYYEDFPGWATFTGSNDNIRHSDYCYPTWQEASEAAVKLDITNSKMYTVMYKQDPLLPSNPTTIYEDFPDWGIFLKTGRSAKKERGSFYQTWEEASDRAISFGIKSSTQYVSRYREDEKLPGSPDKFYDNFPNWGIFLNTGNTAFVRKYERYETWDEARLAIERLEITSAKEYLEKYNLDPLLPKHLWTSYKEFSGWEMFSFREKVYETWELASDAAVALGINSKETYQASYKSDKKLHSTPDRFYSNFPGWREFLKNKPLKKKDAFYSTWQEASVAAINIGATSKETYTKLYKDDEKLYSGPARFYTDFPGWREFLTIKSSDRC